MTISRTIDSRREDRLAPSPSSATPSAPSGVSPFRTAVSRSAPLWTGGPGADEPALPFDGPQPDADTWTHAAAGLDHADDSATLDDNPRLRVLRGFTSRFLPDKREVLVWLPAAYGLEPARRFPVLYLHDGQNLFDGRTSYVANCTWRAHTTADRMAREGRAEPVILVGVANAGTRRMAEYTPSRDARFGGGEGDRYGRLLIEDLKPQMDRYLRTLPDAANTGLAGSSLGGLISLYLGLRHPDVFGKLGVLSPSVWWNQRSILPFVSSARPRPRPRIWLDMGTGEGLRHLRDTDLLAHRLIAAGWRDTVRPHALEPPDLHYLRIAGGLHNEESWARRFDQVLRFLFPTQPPAR